MANQPAIRTFETGATRDTAQDKLDYEGFLSPLVLHRYAQYMHKNRIQRDGNLRDSDNWQLGIPIPQYMKSLWRHFMEVWMLYRGVGSGDITETLCAVMFNVMGYLHELLKQETQRPQSVEVIEKELKPVESRTVFIPTYDPATLKLSVYPDDATNATKGMGYLNITPL